MNQEGRRKRRDDGKVIPLRKTVLCGRLASEIALGCLPFREDDEEHWRRLLDTYFEHGGNFIDTAHAYGGGASERIVGRWIEDRGVRDEVILLTKGCHPEHGEWWRVRPEAIERDLAESLERLRVDVIDIYLLHRDDPRVGVDELIDCLNEQKRAGRIKYFGASNWRVERIVEANAYARSKGLDGFAISSPNLSLAAPKENLWRDCITVTPAELEWHESTQFPLLAWSAQARGFFSGRYAPGRVDDPFMARVYDSPENWERLRRARLLAEAKGVEAIQIALAYVLCQPFPVFAAIGPESLEQLLSSLKAAEIQLTPAELRWLDGRSAEPPRQGLA